MDIVSEIKRLAAESQPTTFLSMFNFFRRDITIPSLDGFLERLDKNMDYVLNDSECEFLLHIYSDPPTIENININVIKNKIISLFTNDIRTVQVLANSNLLTLHNLNMIELRKIRIPNETPFELAIGCSALASGTDAYGDRTLDLDGPNNLGLNQPLFDVLVLAPNARRLGIMLNKMLKLPKYFDQRASIFKEFKFFLENLELVDPDLSSKIFGEIYISTGNYRGTHFFDNILINLNTAAQEIKKIQKGNLISNARMLAQGKRDDSSLLSPLPVELLVKILEHTPEYQSLSEDEPDGTAKQSLAHLNKPNMTK